MVDVAGVKLPAIRVTNSMPLERPLLLTVATVNCVKTLKAVTNWCGAPWRLRVRAVGVRCSGFDTILHSRGCC
jgi:hypothetical protein